MRVEVHVHGGFAGLRRPPAVLDTDRLEPAVARRVEALVAALPPPGPPVPGADLMAYDVRVHDAHGTRALAYRDPSVPEPVRELLQLARERS